MTIQTAKYDADAALRLALWSVLVIGIAIAIVAGIFSGARSMLSVVLGVLIAAVNLWTIGFVVRGYMGKLRSNLPWGLIAIVKFMLLFAGVYGLVKTGVVLPGALFLGYGALPLGIVGAQLSPAPSRRAAWSSELERTPEQRLL